MDFPVFVTNALSAHPVHQVLSTWWSDLHGVGSFACRCFARNISDDQLFERNDDCVNHIVAFGEALSSGNGREGPIQRATRAINSCQRMICAGPPAVVDGHCYRIVAADVVARHVISEQFRPNLDDDEVLWDLVSLLKEPQTYSEYVAADATIRGRLRNAFWAVGFDVDRFWDTNPNGTVSELLKYVGLEVQGPFFVVFRADHSDTAERFVPTGWDAVDNPHFYHQGADATVGFTRDLRFEDVKSGAREFVTREVRADNVVVTGVYRSNLA